MASVGVVRVLCSLSCKMGTAGQLFGLICGGSVVLAVLLGTEGCKWGSYTSGAVFDSAYTDQFRSSFSVADPVHVVAS